MASYAVRLTGPQLRVLDTALSIILNDPDWMGDGDQEGMIGPQRDARTLARAAEAIRDGLTTARRAESTPAGSL